MLAKKTKYNKAENEAGFSLIEAMVATLIVVISFAGVYTLVGVATTSSYNSGLRQKSEVIAANIVEYIESDKANIANYSIDLSNCSAPVSGETATHLIKRYEWCTALNASLGQIKTGESRTITVTGDASGYKMQVFITSRDGKVNINIIKYFSL